jgi:chemotaxis protein histidine kinase CheA
MRPTEILLQEEYNQYVYANNIKDNRQHKNVMARFAFMVAARDLFTTLEIARVTRKNHATVIHAAKWHDQNLKYDRAYPRYYQDCLDMMQRLGGGQESPEQSLSRENAMLIERVNNLRQELLETREKLYLREEEINRIKENELCT